MQGARLKVCMLVEPMHKGCHAVMYVVKSSYFTLSEVECTFNMTANAVKMTPSLGLFYGRINIIFDLAQVELILFLRKIIIDCLCGVVSCLTSES